MGRLLIILVLMAVLVFTITALWPREAPAPVATTKRTDKGDVMPAMLKTAAYVLLIVLLFGVTSGWLGAA